MNLFKPRALFETTFMLCSTVAFSLFVLALGSLSLKFQIAMIVGIVGLVGIILFPARRILCVCLWIVIQPLSIEKILYTAPDIWPGIRGNEIILNVGDVILMLLAVILFFEKIRFRRPTFVWDKNAQLFFALFVWGIVSYFIHLAFYQSEFLSSAPFGILHLFRNLLFVVMVGSAIQTRSDLVWVLLALMPILLLESMLVVLSYSTGEAFNFSRLLGEAGKLQQFSTGGEVVARGTGTLGITNQQASFHAMYTFLLVGVFAFKRNIFKALGLIVILASLVAVIFTFSRTAWFAMGLAMVLIACIFTKRGEVKPIGWLVGSIIAVVVIVFLSVVAQKVIDRLTKGDDGATGSRVRMIMLAKDLAVKYPIIGVSPNAYAEAGLYLYPPGDKETEWVPLGDDAIVPPLGRIELGVMIIPGKKTIKVAAPVHNKYLLTLSELGFVGLFIWLWIFYDFFIKSKQCSESRDTLCRYVGVGGLAFLLIALIYMMLDLFYDDKTLKLLLFPMVVVLAAQRISMYESRIRAQHQQFLS